MKRTISIFAKSIPLVKTYNLSFASLDAFHVYYVKVRDENSTGFGEITPLPGYSWETPESVEVVLGRIREGLDKGAPLSLLLEEHTGKAPFVVSGLKCALETCDEYAHLLDMDQPARDVCLCALCDAPDAEGMQERAQELMRQGYTSLKVKVGKLGIDDEIKRVTATARALEPGIELRLDANQGYTLEQALRLCEGLSGVEGVSYLEQPFKPDCWEETRTLTAATPLPIMLDEAIWTEEHIRRACDVGAKWVKLKLCKHPGIAAASRLIECARSLELGVIWGNGVQSALGNHLEACVHERQGIETAFEGNGFLKQATTPFRHGLTFQNGRLHDAGVSRESLSKMSGTLIFKAFA